MTEPREKPTVNLIGTDGNAFSIIGRVKDALRKAGADEEYVMNYQVEATRGNYEHLLVVTLQYINVM
jgi:hypothetical protein